MIKTLDKPKCCVNLIKNQKHLGEQTFHPIIHSTVSHMYTEKVPPLLIAVTKNKK